jgi:SAM-dependent methyltransferase
MSRALSQILKSTLRRILPEALLERRRQHLRARERQRNAGRSSLEIFENIYSEGKWGGDSPDEGSGSGSEVAVARSYIDYVNTFLRDHPEIARVVDIGCGDFRVARHFELTEGQKYLGTDIVAPLVTRHSEHHGSDRVSFMQLDATADPLPEGDLYLVRQVLQHLSNGEATRVIEKVQALGGYALITEHHPAPSRLTVRNLDKPTGPDVRVYDGSGLYLDHPPFDVPGAKIVLDVPVAKGLVSPGEALVTYLFSGKTDLGMNP